MKRTLKEISPDFYQWPERWMGVPLDIGYGERLLTILEPLVENLITKKLDRETLERHIDNLWLLGGELIRLINQDEDNRGKEPLDLVVENIKHDGGPYCRHLQTENEIKSFNLTCRKLYEYLESEKMVYIRHNIANYDRPMNP